MHQATTTPYTAHSSTSRHHCSVAIQCHVLGHEKIEFALSHRFASFGRASRWARRQCPVPPCQVETYLPQILVLKQRVTATPHHSLAPQDQMITLVQATHCKGVRHAYVDACVCACVHVCVCASVRAYVQACMRACEHACMRACVRACLCACMRACVCA